MEIIIDSRQKRIEVDQENLRTRSEQILSDLGCEPSVVVSIVLVESAEMADLNMKWRGKEGPTNVLSFCQREGEKTGRSSLLGDVVICTDRAADDAALLGYSDEEMVIYLLIHGLLHLLGYDHLKPEDAVTMEEKVQQIFDAMYP